MKTSLAEIQERFEARRRQLSALEAINDRISLFRLWTFFGALAVFGLSFRFDYTVFWSTVPAFAFLLLVIIHELNIRRSEQAKRAIAFYQRALDRLSHKWMGTGADGKEHAKADHLYGPDLDIFGRGSLFQYLNSARTQSGELALAGWLSAPAETEEIQSRQQAVREFTPRIDLREEIAVLGEDVRGVLHPEILIRWGEGQAIAEAASLNRFRLLAALVSLYTLAALTAWGLFDQRGSWVLIGLAAVFVLRSLLKDRSAKLISDVEEARRELSILGLLFDRFQTEKFQSTKLRDLCLKMGQDGNSAAVQIPKLEKLVTWLDAYRNQFFAPFAFFLLWDFQIGVLIEGWRIRNGKKIREWLESLGQIEALSSLSQFAYEHPDYVYPEIVSDSEIHAEKLGHPLLNPDQVVSNDVDMGCPARVWVVSGSNMSGKSTLLRTIGVNAVLALSGAPVMAKRLSLPRLQIGASLTVSDDLQTGTSRFYAEIKKLSQIVSVTHGETPLLFLIDEIFNGTNSTDRRIGAHGLLKALLEKGALGLVTTHDLELTKFEPEMMKHIRNVHFQDDLKEGKLSFDYRLREGVVEKSNALELMRTVGLPVDKA